MAIGEGLKLRSTYTDSSSRRHSLSSPLLSLQGLPPFPLLQETDVSGMEIPLLTLQEEEIACLSAPLPYTRPKGDGIFIPQKNQTSSSLLSRLLHRHHHQGAEGQEGVHQRVLRGAPGRPQTDGALRQRAQRRRRGVGVGVAQRGGHSGGKVCAPFRRVEDWPNFNF